MGSCCCCLCSSILVLAQDSWSPAASGFHLLHSITPADFLGPERNLTDRGEELCQLHCSLSNLIGGREENERFGEEMKIELKLKSVLSSALTHFSGKSGKNQRQNNCGSIKLETKVFRH